jgi:hypothetical protein
VDTGSGERGDGTVDRSAGAAAERHGDDRGAARGTGLGGHPVQAGDDVRVGARARVAKDLDGDEAGSLGDTVLSAADGTSTVSAVAITILVGVTAEGGTPTSTTTESDVSSVDTSVCARPSIFISPIQEYVLISPTT